MLAEPSPDVDRGPSSVRALLESTGIPFAITNYRPRDVVFRQGDPCDSVMYIEKGRVWLAVTARNGKAAICDLLDSHAFLGEEALIGRAERPHSATAMTALQVLVVAKAHIRRLLHAQPELMDRFLSHLLVRNSRLEASLTDHLLYSSEQRTAHTLLALANCDERLPRRCVLPDLPQEIIAEMVGTTRSRVNAFMGKFKKLGFIEDHSGVLHVNPARRARLGASRPATPRTRPDRPSAFPCSHEARPVPAVRPPLSC